MSPAVLNSVLADLRRHVARLERSPAGGRATLPFDVPSIDAALPGGGLALGALHEIGGGGRGGIDGAAETIARHIAQLWGAPVRRAGAARPGRPAA